MIQGLQLRGPIKYRQCKDRSSYLLETRLSASSHWQLIKSQRVKGSVLRQVSQPGPCRGGLFGDARGARRLQVALIPTSKIRYIHNSTKLHFKYCKATPEWLSKLLSYSRFEPRLSHSYPHRYLHRSSLANRGTSAVSSSAPSASHPDYTQDIKIVSYKGVKV